VPIIPRIVSRWSMSRSSRSVHLARIIPRKAVHAIKILLTTRGAASGDETRGVNMSRSDATALLLVGHTLEEVERKLICETLAHNKGNRTHTARVLGISVRCLRDKIRAYKAAGLSVPAPTDLRSVAAPARPHSVRITAGPASDPRCG
jgi:DNA-binding NtrC family response regulator